LQEKLYIGNLDSRRDWGHARDYVRGMWLMTQQERADDYVLATGEAHSVRSFVEKAFRRVGVDLEWRGQGVEERGIDTANGHTLVEVDPRYFRPTEVELLVGDPTKAREKLGWSHEVKLDELLAEMVREDLKIMARDVPQANRTHGLTHV
jgi:GDPmannose 4,6-dehydratase